MEAGVEAVAADEDSERAKFGLSYVLSLNAPFPTTARGDEKSDGTGVSSRSISGKGGLHPAPRLVLYLVYDTTCHGARVGCDFPNLCF